MCSSDLCSSRLVSRRFPSYVLLSALLGGSCAVIGLLGSGLTNLPSGPCVVIVQFSAFLLMLLLSRPLQRQQEGISDSLAASNRTPDAPSLQAERRPKTWR